MQNLHKFIYINLILVICFLSMGATKCAPKNLDSKKAAVYDIQKSIDIFKDGLKIIQTNQLLPKEDIKQLAIGGSDINRINSELIDLAWDNPAATKDKVAELERVVTKFINSSVVVKNKDSQIIINNLVNSLLANIKVLTGD